MKTIPALLKRTDSSIPSGLVHFLATSTKRGARVSSRCGAAEAAAVTQSWILLQQWWCAVMWEQDWIINKCIYLSLHVFAYISQSLSPSLSLCVCVLACMWTICIKSCRVEADGEGTESSICYLPSISNPPLAVPVRASCGRLFVLTGSEIHFQHLSYSGRNPFELSVLCVFPSLRFVRVSVCDRADREPHVDHNPFQRETSSGLFFFITHERCMHKHTGLSVLEVIILSYSVIIQTWAGCRPEG